MLQNWSGKTRYATRWLVASDYFSQKKNQKVACRNGKATATQADKIVGFSFFSFYSKRLSIGRKIRATMKVNASDATKIMRNRLWLHLTQTPSIDTSLHAANELVSLLIKRAYLLTTQNHCLHSQCCVIAHTIMKSDNKVVFAPLDKKTLFVVGGKINISKIGQKEKKNFS